MGRLTIVDETGKEIGFIDEELGTSEFYAKRPKKVTKKVKKIKSEEELDVEEERDRD